MVSASPHAMAVYGSGREAAGVMSSHTPRTGHWARVVALSFSPCRGGRTSQERSWEAEGSRIRGVVLLRQPGPQPEEAETWLQCALDVARRQEAKSLELRAAMSLVRLWQQQGKRAAAYDLLAPIYRSNRTKVRKVS